MIHWYHIVYIVILKLSYPSSSFMLYPTNKWTPSNFKFLQFHKKFSSILLKLLNSNQKKSPFSFYFAIETYSSYVILIWIVIDGEMEEMRFWLFGWFGWFSLVFDDSKFEREKKIVENRLKWNENQKNQKLTVSLCKSFKMRVQDWHFSLLEKKRFIVVVLYVGYRIE